MKFQKYFIIGIIISALVAHVSQPIFAQEESGSDDFLSGVSESFVAGAKSRAVRQAEQACQAAPLIARTEFTINNFTDSLENVFAQQFVDLQRTTCYRNIIWEAEDEIDKILDSYAAATYDLCVQGSRASITGDEASEEAFSDTRDNRGKLLSQAEALQQGITLLRGYGMQGVHLTSEDALKIYGFENFSDDLFKEIFQLTTDINDHPYYCPYFKNGNVIGTVNVTDPEWHPHYVDILSDEEKKDDKKKRKKVLKECKQKMATMKTALDEFFISVEGESISAYPKYSDLTDAQRLAIYEKLQSVKAMIPFIQRRVLTCTDSALSDFIDTIDNIISLEFFENFGKEMKDKIIEGRKEARMAMYDGLCNKITQARKRAGASSKNLPFLITIDGVNYCSRPDDKDMTLGESYKDAKSRSIKNLSLPKGINEIIMENTEAALSDVMSRRLEELARYKFSVDIVKQRAMYKALYDTGTDGVSTALQSLMNNFISVIQLTISEDKTKQGSDALPITKAIWDIFYDLQERQQCGSCSVQKSDFRIIKSTP